MQTNTAQQLRDLILTKDAVRFWLVILFFLLLVQKKENKENDTREGKISFSSPPGTLPD